MLARRAECVACGAEYELTMLYRCVHCGNILDIKYDLGDVARTAFTRALRNDKGRGIWRYKAFLPVADSMTTVSLGEGSTELLQCPRLAQDMGFNGALYVKDETKEPTGSFKDRPVAVAVSKAVEFGVDTVITSSSGNAGASVSAYAARAGLVCIVFVPSTAPSGKLAQIAVHGAMVIPVKGSYSDAHRLARIAADRLGGLDVTTTFASPYPTEGNKTVAYEIAEQLDWQVPDWVSVPVGAGPLLVGVFKGFEELMALGLVSALPRMIAAQVESCAPIVRAFEQGRPSVDAWNEASHTVASAIADPLIGYPEDGTYTLETVRKSQGIAVAVSDAEVLRASACLAKNEGVFAEPAGAASVAAVKKLVDRGDISKEDTVVCLVTGHGLKDASVLSGLLEMDHVVEPTHEGVDQALSWIRTHRGDS